MLMSLVITTSLGDSVVDVVVVIIEVDDGVVEGLLVEVAISGVTEVSIMVSISVVLGSMVLVLVAGAGVVLVVLVLVVASFCCWLDETTGWRMVLSEAPTRSV